jgi:Subtilisin inhibitor-like
MSVLAAILLTSTSLHITVWPHGQGRPGAKVYTLRCAPAGGTLPRRAAACTQLARLARPFAPTPKGSVCTQIYGGPQQALVVGRFRGHLIRARFTRTNGCEIARWDHVRFLFPGAASR